MKRISLSFILGCCTLLCSAQCPPITPLWAFGHITWEDSLNTTTGAERIVNSYLERNIPVDAVIIDSPWTTSYNDFEWDSQRYADPASMIKGFADKGVRTILWLTGNVNEKCKDTRIQKSATYDEVVSNNYGVNDSQPYEWWKGYGLHIDFTNKKGTEWWYSQLDKVFSENVYGWKVDQGEVWLPDMVQTSGGQMSNKEFRHYYYDAMYDYTVNRKTDGIIIARPFSHQGGLEASVEKMNMGWCGDFSGNWDGLKQQIDNIYRSSQYGYGAIGCEVGGFYRAKSNKTQFVRYAQFGCMTACMINGGENGAFSAHLPWYHGRDVEDAYRWCVNWMKELAPYKFSTVVEAHLKGGSLMKSTSIEEYSHLLGLDIFTKAIVSDDDKVEFHLPNDGKWIDFWNGKSHQAGEMITRTYSVSQFPLFIRSGAIIPVQISNEVTGIGNASMKGKRVFMVYPNGNSSRCFHLPVSDGIEYFNCQVSCDEQNRTISLKSEKEGKYIFIVKGTKPTLVEISGKEGIVNF